MTNYTQGGLADVAQHLAQKGRHGDTQLVHMSPKEVRGLQALATANGTSLTTNPTTGLPEAFRLENLIPMAAGAALSPFITPMGAAAVVGGAYGAATGSIEKGLMAGIGAYGGAGLTTGLTSAATQGAAEASAANALGVPGAATGAGSQASTLAAQNASMGLTPMESAANISSSAGYAAGATPMSMGSQAVDLGSSGVGNLGTKEGLTAAYKGMPMGTLPATGISLLTAAQQPSSVPGYQETESERRLKGYRLSPNYQAYQAPTPNPYYRPTYAADGGMMSSFDDEPGEDMARGGVASLGGYSDGGRMLKGPGDGMSDSIPGVIGGRQPARLADGEFVVPADVVSHIGNGSTDAGAKKLYGMMDKIRQARTGKKKQAPQINAEKYLPMKKMASGGIVGYAEGGATPSFSDAQVASYLATNNITTPAQIAQVQATFGVPTSQIQAAQGLLASGSPSVNQATAAYNSAIAANPSLAAQNAQALADRQQALGIQTTYTPPTNPTATPTYTIPKFTDAQVASYLATNNIKTPAQIDQVKLIFNIPQDQVTRAQSLLASNDPSVNQTTAAYNAAIQANPQLAADNARVLAERMAALGITPIIPPIPPALIPSETTPTKPTAPTNYPVYKQGFVPRVSGISMTPAIQDPYSNAGLEALYSQMMGQYARPTTQPMSDAQVLAFAQEFARANPGKGAELGQALINKGVPVNQTIAVTGLSPEIVNQAYLGGQYLGTTPPPTLNTLYNYRAPALDYRAPPVNNLILGTPIPNAAAPAPVPVVATAPTVADGGGGN